MTFSLERVRDKLRSLPQPAAYWVALSGGVDSTVLLHVLVKLRDVLLTPLRAAHVHHGLYPDADYWAMHCQAICRDWSVPLTLSRVQVARRTGESLEAVARTARYGALQELLPAHAMLLTAHHRDDQAETVLLQLLRGAGPAGLAGAAELRPVGKGWLARPLAGVTREDLREYAVAHELSWVEDASNADRSFDRNFLRHEILPVLQSRWPGVAATLARSAQHCGEAQAVLDEVAAELFDSESSNSTYRLQVKALLALPDIKQRLLLRYWLRSSGLPVPDTNRLRRVVDEVARARGDATPCVTWSGAQIRRFQGMLYAMPPLTEAPQRVHLPWRGADSLRLPNALGALHWDVGGLWLDRTAVETGELEIRFGDSVAATAPAGRQGRRSFKRLCQEWGVPPWLRQRVPLIFIDGRLAAIGDYGVCEPFGCAPGARAAGLNWERPAYLR